MINICMKRYAGKLKFVIKPFKFGRGLKCTVNLVEQFINISFRKIKAEFIGFGFSEIKELIG